MELLRTPKKTILVQNSSEMINQITLCKSALISPNLKTSSSLNSLITETKHNAYIKKLNFLLPKLPEQKKLNIFLHLINISEIDNIRINIPITLIRIENNPMPYLIKTDKDKKITSNQCQNDEFFDYFAQINDIPLFYYKDQNQSFVISSIFKAKEIWNSSKCPALIQHFIKPPNPASITRVLWTKNEKLKYFPIINLLKFQEKPLDIETKRYKYHAKKNTPFKTDFKYTNLMLKTSKSVNNPYTIKRMAISPIPKIRDKIPSIINLLTPVSSNRLDLSQCQTPIENTSSDSSEESISKNVNESKSFESFIVKTKNENSCFGIQSKTKIPQIENMINNILSFFNNNPEFRESPIKGLVIDFMQNTDKKWIFLNVKEWTTMDKIDQKKKSNTWAERSHSAEKLHTSCQIIKISTVADLDEIAYDDTDINNKKEICSTLPCPFRIRNKSMQIRSGVNEKEILDRYCKVTERVNNLHSPHLCVNFKEQSIQAYSTIFKQRKINSVDYLSVCNIRSELLKSTNERLNKKNESPTRKHFTKIIENFDTMKFNSKLSNLRNESFIVKYGDQFWHEFTVSLFDKVLKCDLLDHRFENINLQNFTMILDGLFRVFNGQVSLEFRRKVRAVHQHLGITEQEFDSFADLFSETLKNKIDSQDYQAIMSQISSMKCLICR